MGYKPNYILQGARVIEGSIFEDLIEFSDDDIPWHTKFDLPVNDKEVSPLVQELDQVASKKLGSKELKNLIKKIDEKLANSSLSTKRKIANLIVRNRALSRHIKKSKNYICQICQTPGFKKTKGELYAEAHHIEPLSQGGSHFSTNILVLCPTCHRKIHYADVERRDEKIIRINGETFHIS